MISSSYLGSYNYNNVISLYKSAYQASLSNPLNIYNTKVFSGSVAKSIRAAMPSYLSQLNSAVNSLKTNLKSLGKIGISSSFDKKSVTFSATGSLTGTAQNNADKGIHTINVTKLAKPQENIGTGLISNSESLFSLGNNTFSIKNGNGTEKNITFSVDFGDTNKKSLTKMANSINFARVGVSANVVDDTKSGTSYIKLTADKTGTSNTFSLNDVNGNAEALSGIGNITTEAQDAEYILGGSKHSSEDNTIELNNGKVSITLNKAENKDIKINIGTDTTSIVNDIAGFAKDYNKIMDIAHTFSGSINGASKLEKEFGSALTSKKVSLANAGIYIDADNKLKIDESKLKESLEKSTSTARELFSGFEGISSKLTQKANEVISSPLRYTYNTDFLNNLSNQKGQDLFNPNRTSNYSGMLFNMVL